MDFIIDVVSGLFSLVVSIRTFCFLKKEFYPKEEKEECQNCHPSEVSKGDRNKLDLEVLKEGVRLAEVKYHEYEVKFGKRDLKSLAIISLCVAVIGFLLTHYFLSEEPLDLHLAPFLGAGIYILIRASVNAAKVLSPKSFVSIGSEPGKAICDGDKEKEMNLRTLEKYETILKQTFLDIKEKDKDFGASIKDLVRGISIIIGIALFAILQKVF